MVIYVNIGFRFLWAWVFIESMRYLLDALYLLNHKTLRLQLIRGADIWLAHGRPIAHVETFWFCWQSDLWRIKKQSSWRASLKGELISSRQLHTLVTLIDLRLTTQLFCFEESLNEQWKSFYKDLLHKTSNVSSSFIFERKSLRKSLLNILKRKEIAVLYLRWQHSH